MVKVLLLFACVTSLAGAKPTRENPNDVPDYAHEAQTCERVDLRPLLVRTGFPEIRNRGGRDSNESFVLSEMIGVSVTDAISARWLEHWAADHLGAGALAKGHRDFVSSKTESPEIQKLATSIRAIGEGRLRPCLESAVLSEDLESTRLARLDVLKTSGGEIFPVSKELFDFFDSEEFRRATFTTFTCRKRSASKPRTITLNTHADIDKTLRANSLALVRLAEGDLPANVYAIAGRRLNPNSGRCEYLVRDYQGPTCLNLKSPSAADDSHTDFACEDGSHWIERERLHALSVWSVE